jgi:hypothetical protein
MLLPHALCSQKQLAWLNTLLMPVKRLYVAFLSYRHLVNYRIEHNSQVVYLQKVLNDRFDSTDKRIRISDGSKYDWVRIFRTDEKKSKYLKKIYLYDHLSYGDTGADFQVHIPAGIAIWTSSGFEAECRSLLNYYKLAGKRYKLIKE